MKEKWKNLRDTYKKHKKILDKPGPKKYKSWVWTKYMEFLDGGSDIKIFDKTNSSTAEETIESSTAKRKQTSSPIPDADFRRRKRITNPPHKVIDYLDTKKPKNFEYVQMSPSLDKIDYLFLSYADTFKCFTQRKQASLKLELATLFTEAELQHLDEKEKEKGKENNQSIDFSDSDK